MVFFVAVMSIQLQVQFVCGKCAYVLSLYVSFAYILMQSIYWMKLILSPLFNFSCQTWQKSTSRSHFFSRSSIPIVCRSIAALQEDHTKILEKLLRHWLIFAPSYSVHICISRGANSRQYVRPSFPCQTCSFPYLIQGNLHLVT